MRKVIATLAVFTLTIAAAAAFAQAAKMYIYPQKGQSKDQQAKDETECRTWATQQSGVDPNAPAAKGSHARGTVGGAARGAALGAAVGAIAGDAGKGAGAGAVVGGVGGRRGSKRAQQAQQAAVTDSFQRAFAACMEGRGYTVK
jgi:hypothetical protein